jgi:hypothetical protein
VCPFLWGKVLDAFPDTVYGNLPACEFPYGTYAGQSVPDFNQAGSWPFPCHLVEFFGASETLGFRVAVRCLGRGESSDVVVVINRENCHFRGVSFFTGFPVFTTFITLVPGVSK